ncbi:MAG TPA: hypothetical protein VGF40_18180 [Thermoanaerobaculia bacterium]
MLRSGSIALILLQLAAPTAWAAAPNVEIARETVWVKSPRALQAACGNAKAIRACTRVAAILIPGPCTAIRNGWSIAAPAIRASAVMVLIASRQPFGDGAISHENYHVADLRASFEAHLTGLAARRFRSEADCGAAAEDEARAFAARMKTFESATNRNLHARRKEVQ